MEARSPGIVAVAGFFGLAALIAAASLLSLLLPHNSIQIIWRLNPQARANFEMMGHWAFALLAVVATACALAAVGLWTRKDWGRRLAIGILIANLAGDLGNALSRGDFRTLVGIPIAGTLIWYLTTDQVRKYFRLLISENNIG